MTKRVVGIDLGGTGLRIGVVAEDGSVEGLQSLTHGGFPAFGMARRDNETSLNIGMVWQFAPAISLQPSLGLTRNSSNIPLTDFDRQVFSVDIRFDL